MWEAKTITILVVINIMELVKKELEKYIDKIPGNINIHEIRKTVLVRPAHILWRMLMIKQKRHCFPQFKSSSRKTLLPSVQIIKQKDIASLSSNHQAERHCFPQFKSSSRKTLLPSVQQPQHHYLVPTHHDVQTTQKK